MPTVRGRSSQRRSPFQAVWVPRCARCLEPLRTHAKYCAPCKRKVMGIRLGTVLIVLLVLSAAAMFLFGGEPSAAFRWVE